MPGFNAQQVQNKVLNSNEVVILIGDVVVGFGQSASFAIDFGAEGLYGIGNRKPQEIQQLKSSVTFSLDSFQLTAAGLAYLGQPSDISEVLAGNQFNITMMTGAGVPVRTAVGCTAQSNNISSAANQPITEAVAFLAIDVLGSNGLSIFNSGGALTLTSTTLNATTSITTP